MKSIIIMDPVYVDKVFDADTMKSIKELTTMVCEPMSRHKLLEDLTVLKDVDVIFSSWGGPTINQEIIDAAPNLKMVFYAAGTIKKIVTDEFWDHGLRITTANTVNAVPVAEFTLAATILGLKNANFMKNRYVSQKTYPTPQERTITGGFRPKVGLISLGAIAKTVLKFFEMFDYDVYVYDPFVNQETAKDLGVTLVDLETIFKTCDVVSLHTPLLDSTRGMITKDHFSMMKERSTFINTSRGAIIKEEEMLDVLEERSDITAFIDVTIDEPPVKDSRLYTLDNIFLTPHIAGSEGNEIARMGDAMLKEFIKYSNDEELDFEVTQKMYEVMA